MDIQEELFGIKKRSQAINSKRKGNVNELEVTKILQEWTGHEFARVPRSGGLRWKNRMDICGDVINVDTGFEFPFSVETKHVASLGLNAELLRVNSVVYTYWAQCQRDATASKKIPFLMIRQNGMPKGSFYIFLQLTGVQRYRLKFIIKEKYTSEWAHNPLLTGYWGPEFFKRITYDMFKELMKWEK